MFPPPPNTGCTNWITHLKAEHPDSKELVKNASESMLCSLFSDKGSHVFSWIEWKLTANSTVRVCGERVR